MLIMTVITFRDVFKFSCVNTSDEKTSVTKDIGDMIAYCLLLYSKTETRDLIG